MWLSSGIVVGAAWIAKEIGALILKDTASRFGRVGYVSENTELRDKIFDRDGNEREIRYVTAENEKERQLRFVASGHLYNESSTPLLLREPRVWFWAEDGLRVRHVNPTLTTASGASSVVTIPAHGTLPIQIDIGVMVSELRAMYVDAIPVLELQTTRGKSYQFALKTSAMWRSEDVFVAWDSQRKKVVRAGTKAFNRARLRGALGTPRG